MNDNNTTLVPIDTHTVSCQGDKSKTEHPLVYIKLPSRHQPIRCPYCGHVFIHAKTTV